MPGVSQGVKADENGKAGGKLAGWFFFLVGRGGLWVFGV